MLFELISARYERRSMLITANQPLGEWNKVFPGPRHDARRHRSSRLSLDHHRDERRKLSQAHSTRAKTRSRTAALARHPKPSLIDAPRQSKPTKLLRATIFAAIITSPRHQLAILITARFSSKLSRYTSAQRARGTSTGRSSRARADTARSGCGKPASGLAFSQVNWVTCAAAASRHRG